MFCFPNSGYVMFSREFAFCLFRKKYYTYICTWMHVHGITFDRNNSLGITSCGLKWENKIYRLKRSTGYQQNAPQSDLNTLF